MANKPFDRVIWRPLEKASASDNNRAESEAVQTLRDLLGALLTQRTSTASVLAGDPPSGVIGGGFKAVPTTAPATELKVRLRKGFGFLFNGSNTATSIDGVNGLNDLSSYFPLYLSADQDFVVPTPPGANSRKDIIQVRPARFVTDSQSRGILNELAKVFTPTSINKTLSVDLLGRIGTVIDPAVGATDLSYKQGIAAVSPTVPATDPGYIKLCEITVAAGATAIDTAQILDTRRLLWLTPVRITGTVTVTDGPNTAVLSNLVGPPEIDVTVTAGTITNKEQIFSINVFSPNVVKQMVGNFYARNEVSILHYPVHKRSVTGTVMTCSTKLLFDGAGSQFGNTSASTFSVDPMIYDFIVELIF